VDQPVPEALPPLRVTVPLLLIAAGVLLLAAGAFLEQRWLDAQPWREAIFVPEGVSSLDGAIPVQVRNVPSESLPPLPGLLEGGAGVPDLDTVIEQFGLNDTEYVVAAPLDEAVLSGLLGGGRLPERGKPEVLAGALTRVERFTLDGQEFQVVGHLKGTTSGFLFAFLLPESPAHGDIFSAEAGATTGYVQPNGTVLLEVLEAERAAAETAEDADAPAGEEGAVPDLVGGLTMTLPGFQILAMLGLALAAAGGCWAHTRFFRWLAVRPRGRTLPVLLEVREWPRLWASLHVVYFGAFLAMMLLALENPLWSMRLTEAVSTVFTEGELSYITDAFESNNILLATIAIWRHNYLTATVLLTFAISVIPFLGAIKTVLSFALVGFAMAPIWTSSLGGYWYHSITMVLELEAYILASFTVIIVPLLLGTGLWQGTLRPYALRAAAALLSAVLLTGVMLLIAAFYEAATLILLR
jgi:hypothetical protein